MEPYVAVVTGRNRKGLSIGDRVYVKAHRKGNFGDYALVFQEEGEEAIPLSMESFRRVEADDDEVKILARIEQATAPKAVRFKASLERETNGAFLIEIKGTPIWIPKSEVMRKNFDPVQDLWTFDLRQWIAEKKGITGEIVRLDAEPFTPAEPVAPNVVFPDLKPRAKTHEEYREEILSVLTQVVGREVK